MTNTLKKKKRVLVLKKKKKGNPELPYGPAIPPLEIYPKELKTGIQVFIAPLFTIAITRKNPNVHQVTNGYTKCGLSIQWNITQPLKGMKY